VFKILLIFGSYPSYHQVNSIILQLKMADSKIIKEIFYNFMVEYFNHNGKIDSYQAKLLNGITFGTLEPEIIEKKFEPTLDPTNTDYIDMIYLNGVNEPIPYFYLQSIIDNKKYNSTSISDEVLDKLNLQRRILRRMGYNLDTNTSKNNSNTHTNDKYFEKTERALIKMISLNNLRITDLNILQMESILNYIKVDLNLFKFLSIEHYKRTFYISCYERLADFDLIQKFTEL